jgi:acetyl esterase/lipase
LTDPKELRGPFARADLDSDPGLVHDLEPDSPALLIAFGALPARLEDAPLFEFSRSADAGVERTVTVGSSAGGYAALLFGHLLEVDEVLAFASQTFLDPALRDRHGENRHLWAYRPLLESGSQELLRDALLPRAI